MPLTKVDRVCATCGSPFRIVPCELRRGPGRGLYCSKRCRGLAMRGANNHHWSGGRRVADNGYVHVSEGGRKRAEHVLVAERALGHPLPPGAVVHHRDQNRSNNIGRNLVICQDHAYHMLLHVRERVLRAGGNPDTDKICSRCHLPRPKTSFPRQSQFTDGLDKYCRACGTARRAEKKRARLVEAV